jgi:hypothetical protein
MERSQLTRRAALSLLAAPALAQRRARLTSAEDRFLDELSRRAFDFFWERANPDTGLVLDRALNSDTHDKRNVASSAATGFGLTALCIAASRGWKDREALRRRAVNTLHFYAGKSVHEHGWFYHFVDARTGQRVWNCELSSIDTALLLAGVLTAQQFFGDAEIARLADAIYARIDWRWMLNGDPHILTMGWKPETGFLKARWDHYCELLIMYLMGIGSPTMPLAPEAWYAWRRPRITYAGYTYISGAPTLFTHQYSHAWVDFRGKREQRGDRVDWFQNSIDATKAHREFCIDLGKTEFPGCYDESLWGISASDSAKGYLGWGGPPRDRRIDGTVVPCAAAGSLMFEPKLCVQALMYMKQRFGDRILGRYGFVDAFHPVNGWTNPDVIGIDVGITLLSAENARSGIVWRWFMRNKSINEALTTIGLTAD